MERLPQPKKKINFGIKCMKYVLILINVMYLIISFLMISGATTVKVIFGEYYFILWRNTTIDSLSSLWIATGCFLLALSIFGIIAAVKERTLMTNVYGLFLALIFILQMASAITGFTLITQSSNIVRNSLNEMVLYRYEPSDTMNWVQTTFQCCGNYGPFDWTTQSKYAATTTTPPWYYSENQPTTEALSTTTEKQIGMKLPQSCCKHDSNHWKA